MSYFIAICPDKTNQSETNKVTVDVTSSGGSKSTESCQNRQRNPLTESEETIKTVSPSGGMFIIYEQLAV